jgi:hypothetical protein
MTRPHLQAAVRPPLSPWTQTALPERPSDMRVSLAFVDKQVNIGLRFGRPARAIPLDRWRRVAVFTPGSVCCRLKWMANDHSTALWQLVVLQAPMSFDGAQRIAGVVPGACILLRADGELQVQAVLALIDRIEASNIDPCAVAVTYWQTVGNRLAVRQPLPEYTPERHAAHLAHGALQ